MKAKHLFIGSFVLSVFFSGCNGIQGPKPSSPASRITQSPDTRTTSVHTDANFQSALKRVAGKIRTNPRYRKIGLKTQEEKAWFKDLMYKLWHRDITREQFIAEGVKRYPNKRYEFTYIADAMQEV